MSDRLAFEYALIRVVPRAERGECVNAGVLLRCRPRAFLSARINRGLGRLRLLEPGLVSEEIELIDEQLGLIERVCAGDASAGPIAALGLSERWHWLTAPSSTIVQPGPVHTGLCLDPAIEIDRLFAALVK